MTTAADLQAKHTAIQQEADTFIGKLQAELATAQQLQFTQEHQSGLLKQIETVRATYANVLQGIQNELNIAIEVETREAAAKQADQQKSADETKQQMYASLKETWIQQSGDPAIFDEVFPQLYKDAMAKRVMSKAPEKSRANTAIIYNSF